MRGERKKEIQGNEGRWRRVEAKTNMGHEFPQGFDGWCSDGWGCAHNRRPNRASEASVADPREQSGHRAWEPSIQRDA